MIDLYLISIEWRLYCIIINVVHSFEYSQLTDEILKFTVINRGGRKSIPTYKSQYSLKPPRYHGFGIFVLSQLPLPDNVSMQEKSKSIIKEKTSEQEDQENVNTTKTTNQKEEDDKREKKVIQMIIDK